jgi:hypothetical protein
MKFRRATLTFEDRDGEERVQLVPLQLDDSCDPWVAIPTADLRFNVTSPLVVVTIAGRSAVAELQWAPDGSARLEGRSPFELGGAAARLRR